MSTELTQPRHAPLGDVARKQRVRAALKAVGSGQADCARALGLSEATVSRAIAGLQRTPEVEDWIATRTGQSRAELFDTPTVSNPATEPASV